MSKWNFTQVIESVALSVCSDWYFQELLICYNVWLAETYGYASRTRAVVTLPSASRAARGGLAVDDESIPRRPPYTAHISNLPYDVDESAITELFTGLKV